MAKEGFKMTGLPRLVLASASPRRRELLAQLGVAFEAAASPVAEDAAPRRDETPERFAVRLALAKARAVAEARPNAFVLGADTIVVLGGAVLGKPKDALEAAAMLRRLRGRVHRVITGVAVIGGPQRAAVTARAESLVRFRRYSDEEIEGYVASGEPMDKAGAYAIQSELFRPAESVDGCLLNVMGLPCCLVAALLAQAGRQVRPAPDFSVPGPCRRRPEGCSLSREQ